MEALRQLADDQSERKYDSINHDVATERRLCNYDHKNNNQHDKLKWSFNHYFIDYILIGDQNITKIEAGKFPIINLQNEWIP